VIPIKFETLKPPSTHSPGGERDGGSIFWKTIEIGLPSYNDLFTVSAYEYSFAHGARTNIGNLTPNLTYDHQWLSDFVPCSQLYNEGNPKAASWWGYGSNYCSDLPPAFDNKAISLRYTHKIKKKVEQ
jgi:hypothetical protein